MPTLKYWDGGAYVPILSTSAGSLTQAQADARYLQLTGGSVSGSITMSTAGNGVKFPTANTWLYQDANGLHVVDLTVSVYKPLHIADPTVATHAASKAYSDYGDGLKVSLTGGTMTGNLDMSGSGVQLRFTDAGAYQGIYWTSKDRFIYVEGGDLTIANGTPAYMPLRIGGPTINDHAATKLYVDTADALKANLASPTFTGTPAAPTAAALTNTTQLATTAFVTTANNLKANLAGPAFTGVPTAPTAAANNNSTQIATTAYVDSKPSGGVSRTISVISSTTTAAAVASTDYVYICTALLTLTLPTAVGNNNRYTIKRSGTGNVTVATTSSQTIDGITTFVLDLNYQSIEVVSVGSAWAIIASSNPITRYVASTGGTITGSLTITGTMQAATITEA